MSPVIDHVALNVADVEPAKVFYAQVLAPSATSRRWTCLEARATGRGKPFFLGSAASRARDARRVRLPRPQERRRVPRGRLAAGGTDNGAPGIRRVYHANYYGAYVLDPDGNNIEAVTHEPE